jgi:hypothetical protein
MARNGGETMLNEFVQAAARPTPQGRVKQMKPIEYTFRGTWIGDVSPIIEWAEAALKAQEQAVDYRELLKRYMAHVVREEGVSFVEYISAFGEGPLTAEDAKELRQIEAEVAQERLWDREVE